MISNINEFGYNVDLNADGTVVAFGVQDSDQNGDNSGHVEVWGQTSADGSTWSQRDSDLKGESAGDSAGSRDVRISDDGNRVAVYSPGHDSYGTVRVYELEDGAWEQLGSDIDGSAYETWTGPSGTRSMAFSGDGKRLAVAQYGVTSPGIGYVLTTVDTLTDYYKNTRRGVQRTNESQWFDLIFGNF